MLKHRYLILTLQKPRSIYGISVNGSTLLLGFNTRSEAENCKRIIVYYKYKYGNWPLHSQTITTTKVHSKKKSLAEIYNMVDINYSDTDSLIDFCTNKNLGMIFCDSFLLENNVFRIKGKKFDPLQVLQNILKKIFKDL